MNRLLAARETGLIVTYDPGMTSWMPWADAQNYEPNNWSAVWVDEIDQIIEVAHRSAIRHDVRSAADPGVEGQGSPISPLDPGSMRV